MILCPLISATWSFEGNSSLNSALVCIFTMQLGMTLCIKMDNSSPKIN